MKLITEQNNHHLEYVTEEVNGKKSFVIRGIFCQSEKKNHNGRFYPRDVLHKAATDFINERVKTNRAMGELNHPTNGPNVNLDRVCMRITDLQPDGSDWYGRALVIEGTPCGQILKSILEVGGAVGVSTRGLGNVVESKSKGYSVVQPGFKLVTIDAVSDPSGPDCWVSGILEGADWVFANGAWQVAERMQGQMRNMSVREISEHRVQLFAKWMDTLVKA
jgi:hypothetical protein